MIRCDTCVHGESKYCCDGMDIPSTIALASCAHYREKIILSV